MFYFLVWPLLILTRNTSLYNLGSVETGWTKNIISQNSSWDICNNDISSEVINEVYQDEHDGLAGKLDALPGQDERGELNMSSNSGQDDLEGITGKSDSLADQDEQEKYYLKSCP